MVAQVRCTILVRGLKRGCDKFLKELGAEKERIDKERNHYKMICTTYFPCDMRLDFSFDDLARVCAVDITYLFSEYEDQACSYDAFDNLENFLAFNHLSETDYAYGFPKETGATEDLKILRDFLNNSEKQSASESISWGQAFEALAKYDDQLIREGKFMDQVSVSGFQAASTGFPRIRLAAENGDEYAKTLLDNFAKAKL